MEVSNITYNILVNQYCLHGRMDKAKVFNFMVLKGHVPDIASYTTLVNSYIKVNSIDEALRVVEEMIQKGLKPDLQTLKTLKSFRPRRHAAYAE